VPWKGDLERVLERLPPRFSLKDTYRFVPLLHSLYPDNRHIEEKIRQTLQVLRDEGKIRFLTPGQYEQLGQREGAIVQTLPIGIGELTTRQALATLLGQAGDAALRRGMFKPAKGPYRNHMFLFHNETENPYGDAHEGEVIRYVGQGLKGDQEMKGFNATLANHLERGIQVHYFVQPREHPGQIRYTGPVVVESSEEIPRPDEGRTVWVFTLLPAKREQQPEDVAEEYGRAYAQILDYQGPPGPIRREVVVSQIRRKVRDRAFAAIVLQAYDTKCSACGEPLKKGRLTELEAAHIRPVERDGPDDQRNGLSLCRRHHWAFDHGFFTLSDTAVVQWLAPVADPHGEVMEGLQLSQPTIEAWRPHPVYLTWHRTEWTSLLNSLSP
jgi:putative restriction endonuclease